MFRELLTLLDSDTLVLTANRRLSRTIKQKWSQQKLLTNTPSWPSLNAIPLQNWLTHLYEHSQETQGTIINDLQMQCLWKRIIQTRIPSATEVSIQSLASLAQEAWITLRRWELSWEDIKNTHDVNVNTFISWAADFEETLKTHQWITQDDLIRNVRMLIEKDLIRLPHRMVWVGFDEYYPALKTLIGVLQSKTHIMDYQSRTIHASVHRIAFQNTEDEILAMAKYARFHYETFPDLKLGFVVANLTEERNKIKRVFTQVFDSDSVFSQGKSLPFNISGGVRLHENLMIKTAIGMLNLNPFKIHSDQLKLIVHSPYINSTPCNTALGAALDAKIRNKNQWHIKSSQLQQTATELAPHYEGSNFKDRFDQWIKIRHVSSQKSPHEWIEQFIQELNAIGWPGQRTLDSYEYQWWERFQQLLLELKCLNHVSPALTRQEMMNIVNHQCQQITFQPKSEYDEPIQVLGLLESSGCEYDRLWISGLDSEQWPATAKPNPFIPLNVQRKTLMPHSSAKRELIYTQELQNRLVTSAPNVVMSSALHHQDRIISPSYLILQYPEIQEQQLKLHRFESLSERVFKTRSIEQAIDHFAPPIEPGESIKGGVSILQEHSHCPFRAFAKIRLHAKELKSLHVGFQAHQKGIFVHQLLNLIWNTIKDSKSLKTYSDHNLETLIETSIHKITVTAQSDVFLEVERKRLKKLLTDWLQFEKTRPEFKVIQQEIEYQYQLSSLQLTVKIDRIDEISPHKYLIIDYKTRKLNRITDWFGNRPVDLQLPFYSLQNSCVSGIAYGVVSAENMVFKGLISENSAYEFSKIRPLSCYQIDDRSFKWDELLKHWREQFTQLADDFISGNASVDPRNGEETCLHCQLTPLCRIYDKESV